MNIEKAAEWLNEKCGRNYYPVVTTRKGYAEFSAYVFVLKRENKPSVWYCLEMHSQKPKSVKRICNY